MIINEKSTICSTLLEHQFYERRFLGLSFYQCKLCKKRILLNNLIQIKFLRDASLRHVENQLLSEKFLILQMNDREIENNDYNK
jgi:hypothetical protein